MPNSLNRNRSGSGDAPGSHAVKTSSVWLRAVLTGSLVLAQGPAALAQVLMPDLQAISRDVIASPQWGAFKQQLAEERQRLLAAPPAGLPLLTD